VFNSRAGRLLAFGVLVAVACITASRVGAAAQDAGVMWLVFVDDLHLDFRNTGHIRTLLRSIESELIRDGDAFVLRSSGPSPSIPFTTNRSLLDAAIGRVAGNGLLPALILQLSPAQQDELRSRASLLNSLRAISEPTGGFAVLDETDFADALQRIDRSVR